MAHEKDLARTAPTSNVPKTEPMTMPAIAPPAKELPELEDADCAAAPVGSTGSVTLIVGSTVDVVSTLCETVRFAARGQVR